MNFIAQRPEHWNSVVGQERAVRLLSCILKTERFMPRGYLFQGPVGVGKTTCAYLLARALMCTGDDPLGCGSCPSCKFIDAAGDIEKGLNLSSDFTEVDAASNSGVENARGLMDIMNSPPSALSKRRLIIVDESHQLSREAWDVFLKPTEAKDTSSIFIFLSNQPESIPASIVSRLTPLYFERVHVDLLFGLLVNLANQNNITYEHEALRYIAQRSKGVPRDAVKWLGIVASMGYITKDLVKDALHDVLEDYCLKCYISLIQNNQVEAVSWIDEAGRNYSTSKVIEVLFSIYARTPWAEPGTVYAQIASRLPNTAEVSSIFIKWLSNTNLPSDALPLVVYELFNTLDVPVNATSRAKGGSGVSSAPPMGGIIPADDIDKYLN
jgi:DNA polymerase III subunit gamma/tau